MLSDAIHAENVLFFPSNRTKVYRETFGVLFDFSSGG
jgi:hypothetical protein